MTISLILPFHNAEATLPQALRSIAAQRFRNFEVVAVDDGSSDSSLSLLESFCSVSNLPVIMVRHDMRKVRKLYLNAKLDGEEQ